MLNALVGQQGLAHTSATPGRTQAINFFRIAERWQFVDLPGYGYARVPSEISQSWKSLIESYLFRRKALALSFLLLDSRRGWMPHDLELEHWLRAHHRKHLIVATKFDKLKSQSERHQAEKALRQHLGEAEWIPFSAVTGQGVRQIWQTISKLPNP